MTRAKCKETNREEAKRAFDLFCGYYQDRVTQVAVILCKRWKKSEDYAYTIVECAFEKVWLYPTFDKSATHYKDTDKAIIQWIQKILCNEMILFSKKGNCSHPDPADFRIITSVDAFIESYFDDDYIDEERLEELKAQLYNTFAALSEQEVTIFLTYKFYARFSPRVPQSVLKKLRTRYGLTQDGIKHCRLRVEQKLKEILI